MRRSVLAGLSVAAVLTAVAPGVRAQLADQIADQVKAGVPVVGADVCVAAPLSHFQETAKVGAAIAPFVGYQISGDAIASGLTITPIFQPQFAGFPAGCCGDTVVSVTSVSAGARFSLVDGDAEAYFGAQGGYYWGTNGPLEHHSGSGFNIQGGYNYDFWPGTALGLFVRYDNANMHPSPTNNSDTLEFVVTGLEVRHRFLPPPPAPPPPAMAAAAPSPPPAVKKKIVLRGVNFDFNKFNIRPDAAPILDEAAKTLQEYGDITIAVNGYTDSIGSDAYNQALSVRRADAVKAYLESHGVNGTRMSVKGFGKADPVASNATPEGRAQNRRVELIVNNQ